jgi:uncharacterized RDD family membrane protein YckC
MPENLGAPQKPVEPATLFRRLAAIAYDSLLLAALLFCFTLLAIAVRGGRAIAPGVWWFEASLAAISFGFFGWFWTHGGQTLGMRAWRIRLIRPDGRRVSWAQAAVRFFSAWLSALPAGLGYWWGLLDPHGRCWHDRLSRTYLIRDR